MRIVFIGGGSLAVMTARLLLEEGHEVVIVEADRERVEALSDEVDCGVVHGDGTRPAVLKEVSPENTDFLFCLTESNQSNIIAALVATTLEFPRVVTRVEPEFEPVCVELGIQDTIVPDRALAKELTSVVKGQESPNLTALVKGGVRFFSFVISKEDECPLSELELGERSRVIAVNRGDETIVATGSMKLKEKDEVVVIAHEDDLEQVKQRFSNGE